MKKKAQKSKSRSQKEYGVFYTSIPLADKMVAESLSQLLTIWYDRFQNLIRQMNSTPIIPDEESPLQILLLEVEKLISIKICDPAVGEGVFLIAAFHQFWHFIEKLRSDCTELSRKYDFLKLKTQSYSTYLSQYLFDMTIDSRTAQIYILTHMFYGIDIDPEKSAQTILQLCNLIPNSPKSLRFRLQFQIKSGDALLSPELCAFFPSLIKQYRTDLKELCLIREKLKNSDSLSPDQIQLEVERLTIITNELYMQIFKMASSQWEGIPTDLHFFSWWLEFPEVFFTKSGDFGKEGGFRCILSNPPWEVHQVNENEFFNEYDPQYSKVSRRYKEQKRKQMLESHEISEHFDNYRNRIYWKHTFFNITYRFQMEHKYNLAKLFLERIFHACAPEGRSAVIIPAGILTEERANYLRYKLISSFSISDIFCFSTGSDYFDTIAAGQPVCLLVFSHTGLTKEMQIYFEDPSKDFKNSNPIKISLPIKFLNEISPQYPSAQATSIPSIAIPRITQPAEFELLKKLWQHPKIRTDWHLATHRELNRTDDEKTHIIDERPTRIPVLEGKHLVHYGYSVDHTRYFVQDIEKYPMYKPIFKHKRIVWRNVSNINLRRRMYVALIDPEIATVNSLNYINPYMDPISINDGESLQFLSEDTLIYLTGMLGSLVAEYIIRLFSTNNNLNQYLIQNLPIPSYIPTNLLHQQLIEQLKRFFPRANQWAKQMTVVLHQADKKEELEHKHWDLLAQLDSLMMHIYALSETEMELVLCRFEKLNESYKNLVRVHFHRLSE